MTRTTHKVGVRCSYQVETGQIVMEMSFETYRIREVCMKRKRAEKALGWVVAAALRKRLADLEAADTVVDLIAGNPRHLVVNSVSLITLDLSLGEELSLCSGHLDTPLRKNGTTDWRKVYRVKLLRITNLND